VLRLHQALHVSPTAAIGIIQLAFKSALLRGFLNIQTAASTSLAQLMSVHDLGCYVAGWSTSGRLGYVQESPGRDQDDLPPVHTMHGAEQGRLADSLLTHARLRAVPTDAWYWMGSSTTGGAALQYPSWDAVQTSALTVFTSDQSRISVLMPLGAYRAVTGARYGNGA